MSNLDKLYQNINTWTLVNTKIAEINKTLKSYKDAKNNLENIILDDIKINNLTNTKLKINNSFFTYSTTYTMPTLSITLIETILDKLVNTRKLAQSEKNQILDEINKYRNSNKKESISLKKKKIRKSLK
jgi:hypothetical protein